MNTVFLDRIKTRTETLELIKKQLKTKFIGIDDVIDKIINNISLWYLTPELQFRPLIVSLWGITGVGKTDLVRTLVKLLGFTDKFIEIQMDLKNDFSKNIENYLENSGIDCDEPSILLLDEIQRYRTIDENGQIIENKYFNDIWMLLSDGKFQNNSQRKAEIMEMLLDEMYWDDYRKNSSDDGKEVAADTPTNELTTRQTKNIEKPKQLRFKTSMWTASRFKKMLKLTIPVEQIMEMGLEERIGLMEETLKSGSINEGKSYEKLLIFISGNLDEAFKMADDVEETERDADIYHELSKRINIIHIKNALALKFKPEQIARFGNNHIIYPCLDKKSYFKIIEINSDKILDRIKTEQKIDIKLAYRLYDVIYRNGVFPTQGVRPVISTVNSILGNNLPYFMYHAMLNNIDEFVLDIEGNILFFEDGNIKIKKEIILDIDDIRANKSIDEKMLVIVHEIGHALVYGVLFNTPPKQININSAGMESGFVINHNSIDNKTFIRNQIAILLSGLVAEELVFGEDYKSNGSSSDIFNATDLTGRYVRAYAMDGTISRIMKPNLQNLMEFNFDVSRSNETIEKILDEEKKRAKDILNINLKIFKALIDYTIQHNGITIDDFLTICRKNNLNLIQKEINDKLIYSYDDKVKHFLKQ